MLKSLRIKNFAIIDDIQIDFEKGFNVFTGETGAGKSIIVTALSYLFKGRSDSTLIRNGYDKAIIEGVFTIDDDSLKQELDNQDIEYDGELIVKRVIGKDNHSSIKINQSSVTLNFLSDLLSKYVDIHSQKDSQYLFNVSNQMIVFNRYCQIDGKLAEYQKLYDNYLKTKHEYDDLVNNTYNEREIEFFKYDLDELEKANLSLDEESKLEELEKQLKSKEKYLSVLNNTINIYKQDGGVSELLYELVNNLNISDEKIVSIKGNIDDLKYQLDDEVSKLEDILNSINDVDYNLEEIEERLYVYSKLSRKHKTDTKGLIDLLSDLKSKVAFFEDRDRVIADKQKELDKAYLNAFKLAKEISDIRNEKAVILSRDIKKETDDLLLNNCVFKVDIKEKELSSNGIDAIEFLISMNKGEDLKPLKNVASGGEVSRLLLALKAVFVKLTNTDLLILDEIDTGVSGKVGLLVGEKIAKIAKNCQVLCISHLAMVAACASSHYYIYKEDVNNVTCTKIKKLDQEEIIKELANISSTSNDENALKAANDLYKKAQEEIKRG